MTFSEYIENLAERHVDIRHKENDEVHFLSSEREKHTALDSVLHYPAVIVDRGSGFGYGGNPGAYEKTAITCSSLWSMCPTPPTMSR